MTNAIAHERPAAIEQQLSLVADVMDALTSGYALVVAALATLMRPQLESPAEAAARLRTLAEQYGQRRPGYAADLLATADRTARW